MILRSVFSLIAVGAMAMAQSPATSAPSIQDLPDTPSTSGQIQASAVPTGPTVVFDTTMGRMVCKLFDKEAPVTVANFIGLAEGTKEWTDPETLKKVKGKPFYDGVTFHRVIPEFMIQGGDRLGTGEGDAGYFFQDEVTPALRFDVPGRLAMANAGRGPMGSGTNGSQFFITEVPVQDLDGRHTIFGQCDANSVIAVEAIARVDRDVMNKPITPVVINKVTIVRNGQPMPPEPHVATHPAAAPAAQPTSH